MVELADTQASEACSLQQGVGVQLSLTAQLLLIRYWNSICADPFLWRNRFIRHLLMRLDVRFRHNDLFLNVGFIFPKCLEKEIAFP